MIYFSLEMLQEISNLGAVDLQPVFAYYDAPDGFSFCLKADDLAKTTASVAWDEEMKKQLHQKETITFFKTSNSGPGWFALD